jgi:adenosylhomocysteine nucleosidase
MKIGVIGAMDEELVPILQLARHARQIQKSQRTFWTDKAYGHEIFLTRCDPGKVNATIAAQQLIDLFSPEVIFNMGGSGALSPQLEVGDLVIATELIQHDFDLTGWGLKPGELIFDVVTAKNTGRLNYRSQQIFRADPKLSQMALEAAGQVTLTKIRDYTPKIHTGRILSGDQFINQREKAEELWDRFHGLCTDMEAAAIAHTCSINSIPFLCIRSISDKADHSATVSFTDFLVAATSNYGKIFDLVFQRLGSPVV